MKSPLEFKLYASKTFLGKIPITVPKENTIAHQNLETNTSAFLFFSSGVIEIIKRQINDRFEIF